MSWHLAWMMILCLGLGLTSAPVQGAGFFSSGHPQIGWMSDGTRLEMVRSGDRWGHLVVERPNGKTRQLSVPRLPGLGAIHGFYVFEDQYYLLGSDHGNQFQVCHRSRDLHSWEEVGKHPKGKGRSFSDIEMVLPSKAQRFLLVVRPMQTWRGHHGVRMLWATLESGQFKPEGVLPMLYDGSPLMAPGPKGNPSQNWLAGLVDAALSQRPVICGRHLVILSKDRGVFWIVDPENGQQHALKLHKGLSLAHVKDNAALNPIVANVCPAPDGTLLIAARPQKGALQQYEAPKQATKDEAKAAYDDWARANLQKFPEIDWWRLDPESRMLMPATEPPGNLPSMLETPSKWQAFKFRILANGTCVLAR